MKNILTCVLCICIITMVCLTGIAESIRGQENYSTGFSTGMMVRDVNGNKFNTKEFQEELLHDGLQVTICNNSLYEDKYTFMCILNGHVQPFIMNEKYYEYHVFNIESGEQITFNVKFGDLFIIDNDMQYLNVITLGMGDYIPENDTYNLSGDHIVSGILCFKAETEVNTTLEIKDYNYVLNDSQYNQYGYTDRVYWLGQITEDVICDVDDSYIVENAVFEQDIICISEGRTLQVIMLLDDVPYVSDDMPIICYNSQENAYIYKCIYNDLPSGVHRVSVLQAPLFEDGWAGISNVLKLEVK